MQVRETYGAWERRAALSPTHVRALVEGGARVLVQPSGALHCRGAFERRTVAGGMLAQANRLIRRLCPLPGARVFADAEYAAAGAELRDDLVPADLVLGVKQVPAELLLPGKDYMFFSHTIKAQAENMALLDACVAKVRAPTGRAPPRAIRIRPNTKTPH
jgi:alanine dehydrogenase